MFVHFRCLPVPKTVEYMSQISAPVLIDPMVDVLVFEKHLAQFQCRISGEGSFECPALVGYEFYTHCFAVLLFRNAHFFCKYGRYCGDPFASV